MEAPFITLDSCSCTQGHDEYDNMCARVANTALRVCDHCDRPDRTTHGWIVHLEYEPWRLYFCDNCVEVQ